jgi:hypothetical protein
MLWSMGETAAAGEPHEESIVDPRECPFELPPLERTPNADARENARAVRRVVAQAERERAAGAEDA